MEGADGKQDSETTFIIKVDREPAIIINGVPDLPSDSTADSQSVVKNDAEPQVDPRFGEWLEGRKVRKLFGEIHYVGKVANYDSESNWYNVIYDDGDQEDLEWRELEEVLLPLDITVPLKTLVMDKCRLKESVSDFSKPKVGRPRKIYATMDDSTMAIVRVEGQGQQSNNVPGLLPASVPNDMSGQLVTADIQPKKRGRPPKNRNAPGNSQSTENAPGSLSAGIQPRKRGRPPKNRNAPGNSQIAENTPGSLSAGIQPKKRGRPPKNRNAPGNSQSSTPGSLALVPVQDDTLESSRKQNSTLIRNAMTARAEKLKRENLRVQSA